MICGGFWNFFPMEMWLYLTYHSLSSSLGLSTCPIDDSDDRSLCALPEHGFISIGNHFSKVPSQLSEHKDEFRSNSLILFGNFKVEGNLESKSFSTEKKIKVPVGTRQTLPDLLWHSLTLLPTWQSLRCRTIKPHCSACGNTHLLSGSLSLFLPLSLLLLLPSTPVFSSSSIVQGFCLHKFT